MNSLLKISFLCFSMVFLCANVQSRSLQRFASRHEEEKNPLCEFVLAIMNAVIEDADLKLTPTQAALLPERNLKREAEEELCKKEEDKWFKALMPFLHSLDEAQLEKLGAAFSNVANQAAEKQRGITVARGLFKRTMFMKQRSFNVFDD